MVGYSAGGVIAHSLAARFEDAGGAVAGVVMIDTPAFEAGEEETNRVFSLVMAEILKREQEAAIDDASWIVMGTYMRLLAQRRPARIAAPTLLIRASEPLGEER